MALLLLLACAPEGAPPAGLEGSWNSAIEVDGAWTWWLYSYHFTDVDDDDDGDPDRQLASSYGYEAAAAPAGAGWHFAQQLYGSSGDCNRRLLLTARVPGAPDDGVLEGEVAWRTTDTCAGEVQISGDRYPGRLVRVDPVDDVDTDGLTRVGQSGALRDGGAAVNVKVHGGYAFVARYYAGLAVYDVRDPAAPTLVAELRPTARELWNDVKLLDTGAAVYALLAGSVDGVTVVDVTDPTAPVAVAGLEAGVDVHSVFLDGTTAWLATIDRGADLPVGAVAYDLTDPLHPVRRAVFDIRPLGGAFVHDLYVADGVAYLCAWDLGLILVDVGDLDDLRELGRFTYDGPMSSHAVWVTEVDGRRVALEGGEDWGAHLRVVDVDPASPEYLQELGSLALRPEVSIHNIQVGADGLAVVAWYQDGVRLVDVSDPYAPRFVGHARTWDGLDPYSGRDFFEGAVGIDVVDDLVYVADIPDDLLVYRRGG